MKRRDFIKYGTALAGFGGACLICSKYSSFFRNSIQPQNPNVLDTRPCRVPFESIDILGNGECYSCCFLKNNISAGNIIYQNIDEIWNSQVYNDLRQRVLSGDFSMCNRDICSMYIPCSPEYIPSDYKKGPKDIKISYDAECNYNCITCRDFIKTNTIEEVKAYDDIYIPKILNLANNNPTICLIGTGEVFYSRHAKNLIKTLLKNYPELKFIFYTNGFLMNEENIKELGVQNNIQKIYISINAANRETYKKIMRIDGYDTVMKNLKMMVKWKNQKKIEWIGLNFVTHIMNYKEMPAFAKIAQKLDIVTYFSTYRPWPSAEYHKRYDEVAVFEPYNKYYKELVKILHNPIFKDKKHCFLEKRLADIANL